MRLGWRCAAVLGLAGAEVILWPGCATTRFAAEEGTSAALKAVVDARIAIESFDADRLAAAIFAETNRVRREHGLRALHAYPHLAAAADLQAFSNAITGVTSHAGLFKNLPSAWERVREQGVKPELVLENVLSTLVRFEPGGSAVQLELRPDGTSERHELTDAELPFPTYRELAARLVEQWMGSPGHRANLLNPQVTRLACGTALSRSPLGGEVVHACQVFIALPRP